ncbi:MAG TPA: protein kinase, partial [Kofleriaceae bacterium]
MSGEELVATLDESPGVQGTDIGQLGRLKLEKLLGSGGMGAVFEAFDPDLERRVAVKVLHARSADGRTRVLREARAMAKVSHPNVIAVFDVGTVNSTDFVVMELIAGETLDAWAKRAHPSWREIV